ncbi:MAG: Phosphatidyl-myo-inositol alpha-mannosyltransferase [Candidatus Saccharibacteria bacterium GW2011_GWA2_46_10]|nr:MAG: Phosphatidyl-myo-inositol alpha-mannosyltransferase [Candidatus Saccharibacteria bacterium GW2011_GWA2_46_10]
MSASGKLDVALLYDDSLDTTDGVAQYVKTIGTWLSQNGHRVTYLVGESNLNSWSGGKVYSLSKNLKVRWSGNRLSMALLPRLKTIKRLFKEQNFDVVHVQFPYSPFMAQLVISAIGPQTALVGTVHVYPAHRLASAGSKLLKTIYGKSLHRLDDLLSVSSAAQAYAQSAFKKQSKILPNTIDLASYKKATSKLGNKTKHIVFLGRLVRRKGPLQLLKAFALLSQDDSRVHLTIAGDGPLRSKLEKFVKAHGLENKVSFLGFINEADKPRLLAEAQVACFPSLYGESFGIVLIEAMAAGSGVVLGGYNQGYRSVLGARSELLINPKDTKNFAKRLQLLLEDEDLAKQLHEWQSQEIAKYDVSTVGPRLLDIYRQAIAKRTKKRHN